MCFLPTVGAAQSWSQVRPDEEGRQVGCQVEVSFRVGVLRQRQVLHQVIVSDGKHVQVLRIGSSNVRFKSGQVKVDSVCWYLEGIRAMNSSPDGQSFSLYTTDSPSLDFGRSGQATAKVC